MRLGVDLLAIQAPSCRGRGIGRYAKSLLRALLVGSPGWEFVFYRRPDLAIDWEADLDHLVTEWVDVEPDPPRAADGTLQKIVQGNPHRLDWLLIPNPVVERRGFALPEPVPGGPRLAAIVHDLIPALFPRYYLDGPGLAAEYYGDLRRLQSYDLLMANSEATGRDVRERLGVPARKIVNIRAAADPAFFRPATCPAEVESDARAVRKLGVSEPFFYYLGNVDWRKNVLGLLDAYAVLPEEIRATHPLVLTYGEHAWFSAVLRERVEELGLGGRVIPTGPIGDEDVRSCYRRAALFLSPSLYEGFGLPILEAMQCGAAVLVADNSSQPEVAGPSGVLARTGDPNHWAEMMTRLVREPGRLETLGRSGRDQAAGFSWEDSAQRLIRAIEFQAESPRASFGDRCAYVAYPARGRSVWDAASTEQFETITGSPRSLLFVDMDRAACLPPLPSAAACHDRILLRRILPVLGDPRLVYLVHSMDSLRDLIRDLSAFPGDVRFLDGRIASLADLAGGDRAEEDLREVLALAKSVTCESDWLRGRIGELIERESVCVRADFAGAIRQAS